jgi:hypothetical protein
MDKNPRSVYEGIQAGLPVFVSEEAQVGGRCANCLTCVLSIIILKYKYHYNSFSSHCSSLLHNFTLLTKILTGSAKSTKESKKRLLEIDLHHIRP